MEYFKILGNTYVYGLCIVISTWIINLIHAVGHNVNLLTMLKLNSYPSIKKGGDAWN